MSSDGGDSKRPNQVGGKSGIEEGVAAVSSQKVHGKSSARATNRETQGGMSGGSQYSGQTTERPWLSSVGMDQKRVCSHFREKGPNACFFKSHILEV